MAGVIAFVDGETVKAPEASTRPFSGLGHWDSSSLVRTEVLLSGLFAEKSTGHPDNSQSSVFKPKPCGVTSILQLESYCAPGFAPSQALLRLLVVSYSQVMKKPSSLSLLPISPNSWASLDSPGSPFVCISLESVIPHPVTPLPLLVLSSLRTGFLLSLSMFCAW